MTHALQQVLAEVCGTDQRLCEHPGACVHHDAPRGDRADDELAQVQRVAARLLPECLAHLGGGGAHDALHDLVGVVAIERRDVEPYRRARGPQRQRAVRQWFAAAVGREQLHGRVAGELDQQSARGVVEVVQVVDADDERTLVGGAAVEDVLAHHREHAELLRAGSDRRHVVSRHETDERTEGDVGERRARQAPSPGRAAEQVSLQHVLGQPALARARLAGHQHRRVSGVGQQLREASHLRLAQHELPAAHGDGRIVSHAPRT